MKVEFSSRFAFASYIVWASIYGFFALRYDSDPEACWATDAKDVKVPHDEADGAVADGAVDVGWRFRTSFDILFFSSLAMMVISLVITCIRVEPLRKCLAVIGAIAQYALTLVVLSLFVNRFRHSGKVCSGDYLEAGAAKDGYLI